MKKVAMKKGVGKVFEVGEVVLVPLANVDKAKVDAQNLTGVIVKIDTNRMLVQVVVQSSLLKQWYSYHSLTPVMGKVTTLSARDISWMGADEDDF
jgi:hypothetical protein